ncbi:MAG: peptidoglycan-binding protein LysM [Propionibacteriaceae bacterium]|nr:peptidoglycan-binding protein LysM [Propionibacteriaceae bacterium]
MAGPKPHPYLNVLGPVELVNARGMPPDRAPKQCLEYCGWLLHHPGQTPLSMANSLLVSESTRRSNMSRLRIWLGRDDTGTPYLPDAYSGRIKLHPDVSSDWEYFSMLMVGGVQRANKEAMIQSLGLVRGAPLADTAPGQWHWAEQWRIEMIKAIRDIGVTLANQAMDDRNFDLARWAASTALIAAPEDDKLMTARLRTEHLAGNDMEVTRLAMHITRMARTIGHDLPDEMIELIHTVLL